MLSKSENNKKLKSKLPVNIQEAKLALEILSFYKPNLLKTIQNGYLISVSKRHPAMLHLLLYAIFAILPIVLSNKNFSELLPFVTVFYLFLFLLIWNITRKTKKIIFDTENKVLQISNLDYLGMVIRPKQLLLFNNIKLFSYRIEAGRFGRNSRVCIEAELISGKNIYLFDLAYESIANENGKLTVHCLNLLTNK